jgi:hypothetical protein
MNLQVFIEQLAAGGLGTPGLNLFRNEMPAEARIAWLITSQTPTFIADHGTRTGELQIIARAESVDAAKAMAEQAMSLMPGPGQIGDYRFWVIHPKHEPLGYPGSDGGLYEASVNYRVVYTN